MDNRKIIVALYVAVGAVVWFLTRSSIGFFVQTFYQVRRFPGIALANEAVPFLLAAVTFVILIKHKVVNTVMDEVVFELRKVTWPSRDDITKSTTVVLICIIIASFIIAAFDLVFGRVFGYLLS